MTVALTVQMLQQRSVHDDARRLRLSAPQIPTHEMVTSTTDLHEAVARGTRGGVLASGLPGRRPPSVVLVQVLAFSESIAAVT